MKTNFLICLLLVCLHTLAQEKDKTTDIMEQQAESMAEQDNAAADDDTNLQTLAYFKSHPLHINTATADELSSLNILSGLQVQQFINYRNLLGKLISPYELQAIPAWDITTIKRLLPFIVITDDKTFTEHLKARWKGGDQMLLVRYARVLEKAKGYDVPKNSNANYYLGSRDKVLIRYKYNFKNVLQWGLLADKDAGEQFFKGSQRQGFDFYSFHFFARKIGRIKSLAIGDFTVNFGQGLIQWQGLAFKKNADVMSIKRQAAVLMPYTASGEYNFHRGAGITLEKGKWESSLFVSLRHVSANINADTLADATASSLQTGGYHRTAAEIADRNSLLQTAAGANVKYRSTKWQAGINTIHYNFSKPIQKQDQPYNLFALQGKSFTNLSVDYSYTWRNMHFFGEAATDHGYHKAFLNGLIVSPDAKLDVSLVYRNIDRAYQSINANAFTENTFPVNENGLYIAMSARPAIAWRLDAYADVFRFPWLKYRVDAPSSGKDFFVQLSYMPNKKLDMYARFKSETKMVNVTGNDIGTFVGSVPRQSFRLQTNVTVDKTLSLRARTELVWYDKNGMNATEGFLTFFDAIYKPAIGSWSANMRLQYFETGGYNARIYTYENDLLNTFSIPFYYNKGLRYYVSVNHDVGRAFKKRLKMTRLNIGIRWAQTLYAGVDAIGSGLDEIKGNKRSEIKLQLILIP